VVVKGSQANQAEVLKHDSSLPVGCYVIDGKKHQLIDVINMGQQEIHIPYNGKSHPGEQVSEPDFQCATGLKVRVRGEIFFHVTDPVKLAEKLSPEVTTNKLVYDIVISDLRKILAKTPYDQISGNINLSDPKSQDQGWQQAFKDETEHDLEEYGIKLNAFRPTECTPLDAEAAASVKKGADKMAATAAMLLNMGAQQELLEAESAQRLLAEKQEQQAELQAQEARLKQQLAEQEASIQQQRMEQEARLARQRSQLDAEIASARAQSEIATYQREAAEQRALAQYAPEIQHAKLLDESKALLELTMTRAKYEAEIAISANTFPLQTLESLYQRAHESAARIGSSTNHGSLSGLAMFAKRNQLEATLQQVARSAAEPSYPLAPTSRVLYAGSRISMDPADKPRGVGGG